MKKILVIVVVSILLFAAITPHFVGKNVAQQVTTIAQKISDSPGYVANVTMLESNWFTTHAKVAVNIDEALFSDDAAAEMFTTPITLNVVVNHGPLIVGEHAGLGWSSYTIELESEQLRDYLNWQPDESLYHIQAQTNLLGNTYFRDTLLPFTATIDQDNTSVKFDGYQGQGRWNGAEFSHQATVSVLSAKSDKGTLLMNGFNTDISAQATLTEILNGGIYNSATKFSLENLSFANNEQVEMLVVNGVDMNFKSNLVKTEGVANIIFDYAVGHMKVEEFVLSDALIQFELNRLNIDAMNAFQEFNQAVASVEPQKMAETVKQYVNQHLLPMLKAGPEFNILAFKATMAQGKFSGKFDSKLVNITEVPDPLTDPAFWLSHLLANAELMGDKAVLEWLATQSMSSQLKANPQAADMSAEELNQIAAQQVTQLIDNLVQQGFIIATEQNYSAKATLKNKALTVNDKAIPLPF